MKKYFVESIRVGENDGGIACGPTGGTKAAEVLLRNEDGCKVYYSIADNDGMLDFYKTEETILEKQLDFENYDEAFVQVLQEGYSAGFDSYVSFYGELSMKLPLSTTLQIYKYLAFAVRAEDQELEKFSNDTVGKEISMIKIPVCDMEKEFLTYYANEDKKC